MLAPQNNTNDITDALSGSLTTWYQNVDSALKASECVPGYYEYAQAPSYGTQCPIQEGGSTKIDIQTASTMSNTRRRKHQNRYTNSKV